MEAKHAADTDPTYPKPKMLTDKLKPVLPLRVTEPCDELPGRMPLFGIRARYQPPAEPALARHYNTFVSNTFRIFLEAPLSRNRPT